MHSTRRSSGAGFVSLSTAEGNTYTASIPQVILAARVLTSNEIASTQLLRELEKERQRLSTTNQTDIRETNEYAVRDLFAVKPHKLASVSEELEIVVPFVEIQKVTGVRKVWILTERVPERDILGQITGYKTIALKVYNDKWMSLVRSE